jgi:hypothetical protein
MTTSTFQRTAFQRTAYQAYVTVSGMADQAIYVLLMNCNQVPLNGKRLMQRSFALRDAAIKILEDNSDA